MTLKNWHIHKNKIDVCKTVNLNTHVLIVETLLKPLRL